MNTKATLLRMPLTALFVAGSLWVAALSGCEVKSATAPSKPVPTTFNLPCDNCGKSHDIKYKVVCIGGCEYIVTDKFFTHKGDCKNPMHPQQYEKQEVLVKTNYLHITNDVILTSSNVVWQKIPITNFVAKISCLPTSVMIDVAEAGFPQDALQIDFEKTADGMCYRSIRWIKK